MTVTTSRPAPKPRVGTKRELDPGLGVGTHKVTSFSRLLHVLSYASDQLTLHFIAENLPHKPINQVSHPTTFTPLHFTPHFTPLPTFHPILLFTTLFLTLPPIFPQHYSGLSAMRIEIGRSGHNPCPIQTTRRSQNPHTSPLIMR